MSEDSLPAIETGELSARAAIDAQKVVVHFMGTADSRAIEAMAGLLRNLHARAQVIGASEVTIDFRQLEFMNSSCFKAFVTWVGEVRELDEPKQYRMRFLTDRTKLWQRRSLDALRCLAIDLIEVKADA